MGGGFEGGRNSALLTAEKQHMLDQLQLSMLAYYTGDPRRAQHFLKVHAFARTIAIGEGLDAETRFLLEAAALTHDIGIKAAEQKLGYSNGKLQEELGPEPAREMLEGLGFTQTQIDRVCWLIAHHHTYKDVVGVDYQILLEADFFVNTYEEAADKGLSRAKAWDETSAEAAAMRKAAEAAYRNVFVTETGKKLFAQMFSIEG